MDTLKKNTLDKRYQYTIICTFLTGLLSHGLMLTNKISYHDDVSCLFGVGGTMGLGRWGLELLYRMISCIAEKFSMPVWTGFVCFTLIAVSACMINDMLEINETIYCILVGALMIVFPAVTVVFLYMFTAGCYFFALFFNVLAIWMMEKYHNAYSTIGAVICIAFALGIYQAYYSVSISLILFILIKAILQKEEHIFIKAGRFLSVEIAGLVLYFMVLKISLTQMGITLSSYQGIESMTQFSIRDKLERVFQCYYIIKQDIFQDEMGICWGGGGSLLLGLAVMVNLLAFVYIGHVVADKLLRLFYYGIVLALPIAINLIYPMTFKSTFISVLMRYSVVFVYILPIFLLSLYEKYENRLRVPIVIKKLTVFCIVIIVFSYAYSNNTVYTKMLMIQEQATSYFTTLITQIKSSEGYKDEMPVALIGRGHLEDATFTTNEVYTKGIPIAANDLQDWINNYVDREYMRRHCGFSPEYMDEQEVMSIYGDLIDTLPSYPDSGAIVIVDNFVIVKLSEVQ